MRLRATIRLPERLHQDHVYLPLSQKPLRKTEDDLKPRYSEYNPNLPPAAFPTLGSVRADGNEDTETKYNRISARKSLEDICRLTMPVGQKDTTAWEAYEDMSTTVLENNMASNGPMNATYVSNTAKMAAVGADLSIADGMEESDQEEVTTETPKATTRTPTWADLSRRMQTEIFGNLLERYSWSKVNRMLGLTEQECDENEDLLHRRSQQIRFEDAELSAMRAKQLKDLLRVDNSAINQTYPYLLLFRKASRRTFCRLRQAIETDFDFLCCEEAELTAARKFLRAREIDTKFAGDWGKDIVLIQAYKDEDLVLEAIEASPSRILLSKYAETSLVPSQPAATTTTTVQGAFLNWLGTSAEGAKVAYAQHNGEASAANQFLTLCFRNIAGREQLQSKERKREGHDQSRLDQTSSAPAANFYIEPPQTHEYVSVNVNKSLARLQGATHGASSTPCFSLTGNNNDQLSPDPATSVQEPSSFFLEVIGDIITARDEAPTRAPLQRATLSENNMDNRDPELLGLVKTPVFIGLSPSPAPSRPELLTDADEQLLVFSNIGSPETDPTNAVTSLAVNASTCQVECTELQLRVTETSQSIPRSCDLYDGSCQEEEESVVHEDEMVLLSTKLRA
ncbi:hypothetical protein BJY01DRAFT_244119 [Aspergillus pseudoustus]|uniref:Uncharacterized protein n=1 Tax=Aspergillus pseudoustus TaxID=1810923 RepID=A0ABR4KM29_9EURO